MFNVLLKVRNVKFYAANRSAVPSDVVLSAEPLKLVLESLGPQYS